MVSLYNSADMDWETIQMDQGEDYTFDTIGFWRTPEGKIYTAEDSG
jgi:hypothetical protein